MVPKGWHLFDPWPHVGRFLPVLPATAKSSCERVLGSQAMPTLAMHPKRNNQKPPETKLKRFPSFKKRVFQNNFSKLTHQKKDFLRKCPWPLSFTKLTPTNQNKNKETDPNSLRLKSAIHPPCRRTWVPPSAAPAPPSRRLRRPPHRSGGQDEKEVREGVLIGDSCFCLFVG